MAGRIAFKPSSNRSKVEPGTSRNKINEEVASKGFGKTNNRLSSPTLLAYPMDNASVMQGHYIIFQIHGITAGRLQKVEDKTGFKKRSFALKGSSKSVVTQIALYMPPSVSVKYAPNYEDVAIGSTAEAAFNAIGDVNAAEGVFSTLGAGIKGAANVGAEGVKKAASGVVGGVLNALGPGAKELGFLASGKIVTDKMEMVFKGVSRRQFQFEFAFIPKSHQESKQVDAIINAFKIAMLPKYTDSFGVAAGTFLGVDSGTGGEGRTLTIPTTMDIKYYYQDTDGQPKENLYLNKISTCYLSNLDVKYGGDRFTAYEPTEGDKGAPPQNSSISMTFDEIEIITQEAARVGY
jgi:hypothetical protein|tara:strand:- start:406 stop:1452 length:1047 start_codon:yes stop_codon:yes gene_type:complete